MGAMRYERASDMMDLIAHSAVPFRATRSTCTLRPSCCLTQRTKLRPLARAARHESSSTPIPSIQLRSVPREADSSSSEAAAVATKGRAVVPRPKKVPRD